jgi:hypothetical protein
MHALKTALAWQTICWTLNVELGMLNCMVKCDCCLLCGEASIIFLHDGLSARCQLSDINSLICAVRPGYVHGNDEHKVMQKLKSAAAAAAAAAALLKLSCISSAAINEL